MRDVINAIEEEKRYVADRMNGANTSLAQRLSVYGYINLSDYFFDKKNYLFSKWIPEIRYVDIAEVSQAVEKAIAEKDYGVYIPVVDGLYAYHGTDDIDHELCKNLNVRVVDMNYVGGTIIGSSDDFSIEILLPNDIGITANEIITKIASIISTHINGVSIDGNDILINGEKVLGSMTRRINGVFVWAAQATFGNYVKEIEKICNKKSIKKPSRINSEKLTKRSLENEVIAWLRKQ